MPTAQRTWCVLRAHEPRCTTILTHVVLGQQVCAIAAWLGSGISLEELQSGQMPRICGSRAILNVPGVENVDVGDLVKSHFDLNDAEVLESVVARCRLIDG